MKSIKLIFRSCLLLLITSFFISCDDDVPVINTNDLNPEIFFQSLTQVDGAVNARF